MVACACLAQLLFQVAALSLLVLMELTGRVQAGGEPMVLLRQALDLGGLQQVDGG